MLPTVLSPRYVRIIVLPLLCLIVRVGWTNGLSLPPITHSGNAQVTVLATPTQLSGFITVKDTPSANQPYELLITGANGKLLTIAPPTGTEVSLNQNGPFVSQLVITVATDDEKKTVFVRLTGQQPVGSYKGTIYNWLYPDDIEQKVVVEGLIMEKPVAPVSPASLSGFSTVKGTPSAAKSFVITPTSQALGKTITITAYEPFGTSDEFEVSFGQNGPYAQSLSFTVQPSNLPRTVYVRLSSSAPVGLVDNGIMVGPDITDFQLVEVSGTVSDIPAGSGLQLVAPLYNCQSGAFTFQTTGGNGSPITFSAIGITGPTTNPNQFVDTELRTAADAQPIILRAKQSGAEVTFLFDIRATCPIGTGARASAPTALTQEAGSKLTAFAYPNPVQDDLTVRIAGAAGQTVRMRLVSLNGLTSIDKLIQIPSPQHEEKVNIGQQAAGLYLLHIQTTQGIVSLKVIKQ